MTSLAWISVFLVLQGGHSYVLLTASLDDVQAIVKEMVASPVAGQLSGILRRASNIFNQQLRASNAGNKQRSFRRQLQIASSSGSQNNRTERQNYVDKKNQGHPKSSRHDDDQTHRINFRRFNDSPNLEAQESHKDTKDEATKDRDQEKALQPKELEGKPKMSESKERDEDDIEVERHEKSTVARVNTETDEVVALGKNASLYLNSIMKIIETL